jgi:hypothetical protein
MKALMIDVVDYCYDFLMELCSRHGAEIMEDLKERDAVLAAQELKRAVREVAGPQPADVLEFHLAREHGHVGTSRSRFQRFFDPPKQIGF